MKRALLMVVLAIGLTACGEKPQALGDGKKGSAPYSGTGKAFVSEGWKQGDKASWESRLRARTQRGQDDYSRMN